MSSRCARWAAAMAFILSGVAAAEAPKPMPVSFFAAPLKFKTASLSPDGKHIAFTYEEGDNESKLAIATIDLEKITAEYSFGEGFHVGNEFWASNERLVMDVWENTGYLDGRPQNRQTFSGGYDGSNRRQLSSGSFFARIIDRLETDPDNVLVARYYADGRGSMKMHRTNIVNGRSDYFTGIPAPSSGARISEIALDTKDRIRLAIEMDDGSDEYDNDDDSYVFHIKPEAGEWRSIVVTSQRPAPAYRPLGFGAHDRVFYFLSNYDQPGRDTLGVFGLDVETGEIALAFRHPDVDIEAGVRGPHGEIIGVRYSAGYPSHHYFEPESDLVKQYRAVEAAFPGQFVEVTSFALDAGTATVRVSSDRNPGELYLYKDGKLRFLAAAKPENDPARLGTQEAFTMTARDGMKLYGLITFPPGVEQRDLPMVVHPHGGPHGPYDRWGYDPMVQLMASHGYAVLQVNFRGSGGYGEAFEHAGYRRWGREMQHDVTDATRWAIDEGIADPKRICIFGGSYGGYAALQGTVNEPDLYRCAVGYVGVYSLPMYRSRGDYRRNRGASNQFLGEYVGSNQEELEQYSPAYNVDRIKADLFLVHGSEDVRVPIAQAKFMAKQLDAIGKPYEWMVRKEGHGFQMEDNRKDLFEALISFFDRHIGPNAGASMAAGGSAGAADAMTAPAESPPR